MRERVGGLERHPEGEISRTPFLMDTVVTRRHCGCLQTCRGRGLWVVPWHRDSDRERALAGLVLDTY